MACIKTEIVVTRFKDSKDGKSIGQRVDEIIQQAIDEHEVLQQVSYNIDPEEWVYMVGMTVHPIVSDGSIPIDATAEYDKYDKPRKQAKKAY